MSGQLTIPDVKHPAITQEQFDYDNNRQIADAVLENPTMLAFMVRHLSERMELAEGKILWLTKVLRKRSTMKSTAE